VAAGLVSQGPIRRVLAGQQTVSATAAVSLSGFKFTVSTDAAYGFEFGLIVAPQTSTAGLKLFFSTPSNGGNLGAFIVNGASPNGIAQQTVINGPNQTVQYVTCSMVGNNAMVLIRGMLKPTQATMCLKVGNNISGATTSTILIQQGSYGYIWRMG
jgi:hypothetical protein